MRWLGVRDAETTRGGADGGVEVTSGQFVAQVKIYDAKTGSIGIDAVRQIAAIEAAEQRKTIFFATCRYTDEAIKFAEAAGVLSFWFSAVGNGAQLAPRTDLTPDFASAAVPDTCQYPKWRNDVEAGRA
ncbi:hypothetical protein GY24_09580 [Microterricola pindariensis]|uniref:Restriction endonuclease type IV Mrr domain-containing protein n=1 Tax=Microterricola pindariensis TaxID=478010 RepID=A0ABX5AV24_9MICO|nr:hypothetical protein GY24_09580 [Microterricola pindariensis]